MDLESLVGIMVLYKCSLEKSKTVISLNISLGNIKKKLTLYVYDNGPTMQYVNDSFEYKNFHVKYQHNPKNPGISKAYNEGANYANSINKEWLLVLDEDTIISHNFIESFLKVTEKELNKEIVCIIPKVLSVNNKKLISPSIRYCGGILRPAIKVVPGIIRESVTSINSGTYLSVSFIKEIGGFSDRFPLDMLDHWYFREINRNKKKILLLDTSVLHSLSVDSFFNDVSIDRYESILKSEKEFFSNNALDLIIYKIRLVYRLIRQTFLREKKYVNLTLKYLFIM